MFIDLIIYSSVYLIFYLSILFDFCEYLTGHTLRNQQFYTSFIYNLITNCTFLQCRKHILSTTFKWTDTMKSMIQIIPIFCLSNEHKLPKLFLTYSMYILYTSNIKLGKWKGYLILPLM